jgi:2-keto-4-pentenoate hydratase
VSETLARARFAEARSIAEAFVAARRSARPIAAYPGAMPPDLASAYDCQDAAITLWKDEIGGWKVGRSPAPHRPEGFERLVGPIFRRGVRPADGTVSAAFIDGGFAAVEAEFVFRLGRNAPPDKTRWTGPEALDVVGALHVGVECAGSPYAEINDHGAAVVISDFGNNAGLILGPEVADWRERPLDSLACETFIDDRSVGRGTAAALTGGPVAALAFALGVSAERGLPLKAGQLVSTGAATGVHVIAIGQRALADFGALGKIACEAVRAEPA